MAKALADRLAEAFAERLHQIARRDWGYGREEQLTHDELIAEKYRGIRPAPGYPACPDHTEKQILFDLLGRRAVDGDPADRDAGHGPGRPRSAGSISPIPSARYFSVDRITREQVEDYARRKGMKIAEVERWLGAEPGLRSAVGPASGALTTNRTIVEY